MYQEVEQCEACERIVDKSRLIPISFGFICADPHECIAHYTYRDKRADDDSTRVVKS